MSVYSVGGGGHYQYPYGIGEEILGPDPNIWSPGSDPSAGSGGGIDDWYSDVSDFDTSDFAEVSLGDIDGLDFNNIGDTDFIGSSDILSDDSLASALMGEDYTSQLFTPPAGVSSSEWESMINLDLDNEFKFDIFAEQASPEEFQKAVLTDINLQNDWLNALETPSMQAFIDTEYAKINAEMQGKDWTDTLTSGLAKGFGFLGDFLKDNPKLLGQGVGYLFSSKLKDDMKKSRPGMSEGDLNAAAMSARLAVAKKRPKWLMPVVIGGSVLVLGLVTWLAFSGD